MCDHGTVPGPYGPVRLQRLFAGELLLARLIDGTSNEILNNLARPVNSRSGHIEAQAEPIARIKSDK